MQSLLAISAIAYCLIAVLLVVMMRRGRGVSARVSGVMAALSLSFAGLVTVWMLTAG